MGVTWLAIAIALVDACCFGVAAVLQHRGVHQALDERVEHPDHPKHRRINLGVVRSMVRQPIWLVGVLLICIGSALHVIALFLAPVTVIQPIGALAVPLAVVLSAKYSGMKPTRAMIGQVTLSVVAIAIFVWLASGRVESSPAPFRDLIIVIAVLAVIIAIAWLIAHWRTGWVQCIAYAFGGAVAFGLLSALMRAISQHLNGDIRNLLHPETLVMIGAVIAAVAVGGFLVQHAYSAGAPEVVLACVTMIDPLIAVLVGFVLLGEGAGIDTLSAMGMGACAIAAAAGVLALARYHPGTTAKEPATSH